MSRQRPVPLRRQIVALASCLALVGIAACGQQDRQSSSPTDSTCDGKLSGTIPTYITAWFHDSGVNTDEAQILREQVSAFNATEQQVQVKLITLPVGDYAQQVQAAAAHGGLVRCNTHRPENLAGQERFRSLQSPSPPPS